MTTELQGVKRFLRKEWAKSHNQCTGCYAGIEINFEKGKRLCPKCGKEFPPEITRQMIEELVEARDKFKFWCALCSILNIPMRMHEMRDGESLQIAFSTTNDLLIAFHRAYGGE